MKAQKTAAELIIERLDALPPEEHQRRIRAARARISARRLARRQRAEAAVRRLRGGA